MTYFIQKDDSPFFSANWHCIILLSFFILNNIIWHGYCDGNTKHAEYKQLHCYCFKCGTNTGLKWTRVISLMISQQYIYSFISDKIQESTVFYRIPRSELSWEFRITISEKRWSNFISFCLYEDMNQVMIRGFTLLWVNGKSSISLPIIP